MLAKHSVHYDLIQPKPAWAEQDPEHILEAVIGSIRGAVTKAGLSPDNLLAIGISTAMHSLIAVDQNGGLLTKSIIWADNRSAEQSKRILKEMNGFDIYKRTGTPIHPMSPLSKIVWMKEQDKETFAKTAKFISMKEYILHEFFGTYVVDYSIASATGLFRLDTLSWDEEALRIAGIREDQLSDIVPTTHQLRGLAPEIAARMGIHADTPFIIGANDGVLANLGVGAIGKGEVAVTIGTSGAVRSVTDAPIMDEKARTFCYALTDKHWVIGGPTNNGGIMLRWLRDEFASPEVETAKRLGIDPYDLMIDIADKVPAGSEGLLFLPFLSGERAPFWNPNARGTFFGISLRHKREHFIRAVLEGVIMSVFSIGVALRDLAGPQKTCGLQEDLRDRRFGGRFCPIRWDGKSSFRKVTKPRRSERPFSLCTALAKWNGSRMFRTGSEFLTVMNRTSKTAKHILSCFTYTSGCMTSSKMNLTSSVNFSSNKAVNSSLKG